MDGYKKIQEKLRRFSAKYYTNNLIKGGILFLSLGLLYFLFTLFIESFLWLQPVYRTFLFWLFIIIEITLFVGFIAFPIFKLVGLQKGISLEECSKIIGNHFPEVKDKLLNILQLKNAPHQSDLLLASIEQKSNELTPVPFTKAIDLKKNRKYLKYLFVPLLILGISFLTGTNTALSDSLNRVVNHRTAYVPPAPFSFYIDKTNLQVIQGKPLTIQIKTQGEVIPQEAKIYFKNQQYYLENHGNGLFYYTFAEVIKPISFYVAANGIQSKEYLIQVVKTPTIRQMTMRLLYPSYLKRPAETISNTGNGTVPEGTVITWQIQSNQTDSISFISYNNRFSFKQRKKNDFVFSKKIIKNTNYQITTSNYDLKNYEKLSYTIDIIKDEYPTINVQSNIDSISMGPVEFAGQIADDYGFQKLQLVYYDTKTPNAQKTFKIPISKEHIQHFYYQFPEGLTLENGVDYELFFQVFDNDVIHGNKKTSSKRFSYRKKTEEEEEEELLNEQKNAIDKLKKSLEKQQENKSNLEKIQFNLQNKEQMNWNDQKKINHVIKRQEQYREMMQRQTKKLQENFDEKKEENPSLQEKKEDLQKRIEELKRLEKEQKLLNELKEVAKKLNKEDLLQKAKKLSEHNKQQEKSLERILEMTKRFYVEQKITQLANKLENLAKEQEKLAKQENTKAAQEKLQQEFKKIQKELTDLQKENSDLKEPMVLPSIDELQKEANQEMTAAQKNLAQKHLQKAKNNQKKAARKIKQISNKIEQAMQMMSAQMQEENKEDLRQILENLVIFSFEQEGLMKTFETSSSSHPNFGKNLQKQYQLKSYFEHIDDSLYVLSIRTPKITTAVQDALANAHYNLDQSLENFAENRFSRGLSNQQYVMTAANVLADMLSNVLQNMQNSSMKMGSGKGGKGKSFSLPDIIQKQEELIQGMKKGMKNEKEGKPKEGENGKPKQGGNSEESNGNLYKIYQEQAQLRQQLQEAIKQGGNGAKDAIKALKKMEQLEQEILNSGFNQGTLKRMQKLHYELLKLDKATFEQGEEKRRKFETNLRTFDKKKARALKFKKRYFNQTEILNRQSLPLHQNYKKKVQEYFKQQ